MIAIVLLIVGNQMLIGDVHHCFVFLIHNVMPKDVKTGVHLHFMFVCGGGGGGTGFLVLTGGWLAGVGSANSTCSTLCITPNTCSTLCITTNALWSAPKNLCSTSSTQVRVPLVPCVRPQVSCKLFGVYPKCPANYSVVGDQAAPFWAQWTQF